MAISIRTSVLLLAVISHGFGWLHNIDELVDGLLADLRTNYESAVELDDLKVESGTLILHCFNGTGSSLASLRRHGRPTQDEMHYLPHVEEIMTWTVTSIEPFTFRYEECAIRNETDYEFVGPIAGSTMFSSADLGLLVLRDLKDEGCTVRITSDYHIQDLLVVFDKAYDSSTIFQRFDRNRMQHAVKQDIISSINELLKNCRNTMWNNVTMCN